MFEGWERTVATACVSRQKDKWMKAYSMCLLSQANFLCLCISLHLFSGILWFFLLIALAAGWKRIISWNMRQNAWIMNKLFFISSSHLRNVMQKPTMSRWREIERWKNGIKSCSIFTIQISSETNCLPFQFAIHWDSTFFTSFLFALFPSPISLGSFAFPGIGMRRENIRNIFLWIFFFSTFRHHLKPTFAVTKCQGHTHVRAFVHLLNCREYIRSIFSLRSICTVQKRKACMWSINSSIVTPTSIQINSQEIKFSSYHMFDL